jgi:tRNA threonylcarbamoyladenosine biosynthesis protein TsaE
MSDPVVEITTASPEETEALGRALGRAARGGELLGMTGELGAGKTCLVRGLAAGLGADPELVHSPTFTTVTEYRGGRHVLQHVDCYRMEGALADATFLREFLWGDGVAAVEWIERLGPEVAEEALLLTLRYAGGDRRTIRCEAHGERHARWLADTLRDR